MNTVSVARNLLFIELVKRGKGTYLWRVLFSLIFVASALFTYNGKPSLVFCVGKVTTTFAYGSKNMKLVRIMTIVTSVIGSYTMFP